MCAKTYKNAAITGIDYWGKNWEYSREACERNSEIEGVRNRVAFQKASASSLPFENEAFDAVVSNLTFHEVKDAKDKIEVVKEALRVLRKGGSFSFQDLFLLERSYGDMEDLLAKIKAWGVTEVEFFETRDSEFIPSPLKLPFMVGTMGVIAGKK
jgi:ubiquinone/menaquinone biosynthesis C-methylase UbiE